MLSVIAHLRMKKNAKNFVFGVRIICYEIFFRNTYFVSAISNLYIHPYDHLLGIFYTTLDRISKAP